MMKNDNPLAKSLDRYRVAESLQRDRPLVLVRKNAMYLSGHPFGPTFDAANRL
jgi:hypothetical protein